MPYRQDCLDFDRDGRLHEASIEDDAILFRVTSPSHNTPDCILNGLGPVAARRPGRFNTPDQLTTYCANNVLVAISEVLFHMYRNLISQLKKGADFRSILRELEQSRSLVVFKVRAIENLVLLHSEGLRVDYNTRISGTYAVWPEDTYHVFDSLNNEFRERSRNGVIYPSARHSRDICLALFRDLTSQVDPSEYHTLPLKLRLIPEDHPMDRAPEAFSPFERNVHSFRGYYEFEDRVGLAELDRRGCLNPSGIPPAGTISFTRQSYSAYPLDSVTPVV